MIFTFYKAQGLSRLVHHWWKRRSWTLQRPSQERGLVVNINSTMQCYIMFQMHYNLGVLQLCASLHFKVYHIVLIKYGFGKAP